MIASRFVHSGLSSLGAYVSFIGSPDTFLLTTTHSGRIVGRGEGSEPLAFRNLSPYSIPPQSSVNLETQNTSYLFSMCNP